MTTSLPDLPMKDVRIDKGDPDGESDEGPGEPTEEDPIFAGEDMSCTSALNLCSTMLRRSLERQNNYGAVNSEVKISV